MMPFLTTTLSPGKAMTRLMMYWFATPDGAEQVIGFLMPAALYSAILASSSLAKTMIWPRSGMYSLPLK